MTHILVADQFEAYFIDQLGSLPAVRVQYLPTAGRAEVLAALASAQVLVLKSKLVLDAAVLQAAPNLRLIIRAGVGMDGIDLQAAQALGISVLNTPGANAQAVGEQAVGMLLSLLHRISKADSEVRHGQWLREANRATELGSLTVGIIGYGATGSAFAARLSGFGCRVLAYDKYKSDFGTPAIQEATLDDIFREADVLSLHVPLTPETHHMVGATFLQQFARPIWLLNLSRGPVVHTPSLLAALENGQVQGAALDVLETEPPAAMPPDQRALFDALVQRTDVILTPHIGGWSHESARNINAAVLAHLLDFLKEAKS